MWPLSRSAPAQTGRQNRRRTDRFQLAVELLEERAVPSTVPNDPMFGKLWGMQTIHASEAWDLTTGSSNVVVAVIDTGVDYTHRDLYKNIWLNQEEIPREIRGRLTDVDRDGLITFWDLNEPVNQGPGRIADLNGTGYIDGGDLLRPTAQGGWVDGRDGGGNGYTDDLIGWDFGDNDNDPMDHDDHGTHVAGTIGAVGNNGVGVTGVAWRVQTMPVKKVTDRGTATVQNIIDSLYYAVDNGARVSNNSYGDPASALTEAERTAGYAAIQYAASKDHLFVTGAQNQGSNNDLTPILPANYDLPNIITVAATDKKDTLASFSNYGATSVDLGAPGRTILSTVPDDHFTNYFGTSMATPHVAGAAALILSRNPNLSYSQVKALILDNVDPLPDLAGKTVTGGRLNVFKAVNAAAAPSAARSAAAVPNISIHDVTRHDGDKGFTQFTFTVTLSAAYDQPVTLSFRNLEETAKASEDYVAKTCTLILAPGKTKKAIAIEVKDGSNEEAGATFYGFSVLAVPAANALEC
jgi:subtilisin family serine protease